MPGAARGKRRSLPNIDKQSFTSGPCIRDIAARLHEEIRKLRPQWDDRDDERGAMKVVMTGGPGDPEGILPHVRSKAQRQRLAERFKDPADDFRLAIMVDMWLTGSTSRRRTRCTWISRWPGTT